MYVIKLVNDRYTLHCNFLVYFAYCKVNKKIGLFYF